MKLARLRLRNFRCYKEEITFDFDDLTAFIGKNDVGKSSIMDALDIFFNDNGPDKNDAAKAGNPKDLAIICEFVNLPEAIIVDEDFPTSLANEYLLNAEGRLEIHKTYSGNLAAPKCTSIRAFAQHPTQEKRNDLLQLKNGDLKDRANELEVDLSGIDVKINSQIRSKIWETGGDLQLKPTFVALNDENGKKTWEAIRQYLPIFALFKSDRESTDQDAEAQDPLKTAIKGAIKQKENELNSIITHIESEVKRIAAKTVEKLKEMDPSLASQLNPQFVAPKWDSIFKASFTGDEDIPVNKRGSGVRRLILLNFFRAQAEENSRSGKSSNVIYAIEEPETSQHPHNQRLLVSALTDLSVENQVIITTHTPMLVRSFSETELRYVREVENKRREVLKGAPETRKLFARELGVLPDNEIRIFIGVEGKHDISLLKNLSRALINDGEQVKDLEKMEADGELIFFPLGGSSLVLWTSRLANLNRPEFHLFDRDFAPPTRAKYQDEADAINCRTGCKAVITAKRETENYLHFEAINSAYRTNGIELGLISNFGEFDDVPRAIAELVHVVQGGAGQWSSLADDIRSRKEGSAKAQLNGLAATKMTKKLLAEIDPANEVLSWFDEIQRMVA